MATQPAQVNVVTVNHNINMPTSRCDIEYVKSRPGIAKILQIVLCILVMACERSSYIATSRASFVYAIAIMGFLTSQFLLWSYIVHLIERSQNTMPWVKLELGYYGLWSFFYLLGGILLFSFHFADGALYAAAVFSLLAVAPYGYDLFCVYGKFRSGDAAQGGNAVLPQYAPSGLSQPESAVSPYK